MQLIATYDFSYGTKGRMDAEVPIVRRGEAFDVLPTVQASAAEVARFMIDQKKAMTPEDWAKRKPKSDEGWEWAQEFIDHANAQSGRSSGHRR